MLRFLVDGDEKLTAFRISNGSDFFVACRGEVDYVRDSDVKRVNGDDFCGIGKGYCFCHSDGDTQPGEAAWADRDIDVLDLVGFFAEAVEQATDGWKELGTVSRWAGK